MAGVVVGAPETKGLLLISILADVLRLEREGRISREELEEELGPEALKVIDTGLSPVSWYSPFVYRDLALSDQSLVLAEITSLAGHRVYRDQDDRAGAFVTSRIAGAKVSYAPSAESFLNESAPGDYLVVAKPLSHPALELVRSNGHYRLYRHLGTRGLQ